ncbi:MAG: ATP-binding cassette domain-containing protein, partial [Candidatus Sumerlaeota bacterium]
KDHDAVEEAIHALQLDPLRHRLYRDLSGGERQKTQLARLLAQGADLFLIDEPAAGLDLDWQERLTQLIEWLYLAKGKTIVVVTHDVDLLPASCKQVILLKEAQAEAVGAPAELFTREILSDLYACEMEVAQRRGRYHAYSTGLGEGDRRDKEAEPWT